MDDSRPIESVDENNSSTDSGSSCSYLIEGTPNPFGKKPSLVCHQCGKTHPNYKELRLHWQTHFSQKPDSLALNQNEEDSNITLCKNSEILVNETTFHSGLPKSKTCDSEILVDETSCHSGLSTNETCNSEILVNETSCYSGLNTNENVNNSGLVVNETVQLLLELADGATKKNETELTNRTTIVPNLFKAVSSISGAPSITIIRGTDTSDSLENRTLATRQTVLRERFSESHLDYVDNTPSARNLQVNFKTNRKKSTPKQHPAAMDHQLLYPGKYVRKLTTKKKVEKRKTYHKSRDALNENTTATRGRDNKLIRSNHEGKMNETCYSRDVSVDETCENPVIFANETCYSETILDESHLIAGEVRDAIGEQRNEDRKADEMIASHTDSSLDPENIYRGSDMDLTGTVFQSEIESGFDMDFVDSTPFVEKMRYGLNLRKRRKPQQPPLCSVSMLEYLSTSHRTHDSSIDRKSKSVTENLSLTCMSRLSNNTNDSCDVDEISNDISDESLDGSHFFERNRNRRENAEGLSPTIVRESMEMGNIPELFSYEDLLAITSKNREIEKNNGFLNSIITDSDVEYIDFNVAIQNIQHSRTNLLGINEDNKEFSSLPGIVDAGNDADFPNISSSQNATSVIGHATSSESAEDATSTEEVNQSTSQSEIQVDSSDSETEFPQRPENPIEWLRREHRMQMEDWCIGKIKTEFKCKYCGEEFQSHDQLSGHVLIKHM